MRLWGQWTEGYGFELMGLSVKLAKDGVVMPSFCLVLVFLSFLHNSLLIFWGEFYILHLNPAHLPTLPYPLLIPAACFCKN